MRIAIVNDMQTCLMTLRYIVESEMGWDVLWHAEDGKEAVSACAQQLPDMILMDLIMPEMDGVEATRRIVAEHACPILVVTAGVEKNSTQVFEALSAGALDAVDMPAMNGKAIDSFVDKLNMVAKLIEDN